MFHGHWVVLKESRTMPFFFSEREDQGTNDLLVGDEIRTNELQVWFIAEHVVDTAVVERSRVVERETCECRVG